MDFLSESFKNKNSFNIYFFGLDEEDSKKIFSILYDKIKVDKKLYLESNDYSFLVSVFDKSCVSGTFIKNINNVPVMSCCFFMDDSNFIIINKKYLNVSFDVYFMKTNM